MGSTFYIRRVTLWVTVFEKAKRRIIYQNSNFVATLVMSFASCLGLGAEGSPWISRGLWPGLPGPA